jgi:hypothetical protein
MESVNADRKVRRARYALRHSTAESRGQTQNCSAPAISVAKGDIADIDRRPSVAEGDAFDPKLTSSRESIRTSAFAFSQPQRSLLLHSAQFIRLYRRRQ